MKTKKVNISVLDYTAYEMVVDKVEELGITVLRKSYNVQWSRYDIMTEMNIDQCKEMLRFVKDIGGFLWKGE